MYGGVYDRAIQSRLVRRLAPLAYGEVAPITHLDRLAERVARAEPRLLLDVPTGGGTLIPMLRRAGYHGCIVAADLGAAMLRRARRLADEDVALLQADATDLPLVDGAVDAAISLNGLHVMPDQRGFVDELARVVAPGGRLWLVTLIGRGNRRGDLIALGARAAGIIPAAPPTRDTLLGWLDDAGFADVEPLGGEALTGLAAVRR